ncbi:MAG: bifunctional riboflavin kinase/FAD synthetase [Bacteroidales bacterium]|nr:bifunctional riboflavin kinase/FAD synthetase [Bacteroidales bacterium]
MIVHRDIEKFEAQNPVATVGIFDGVHLGHKYIIEKLISGARERGGESVLVTLWPHPGEVLSQSAKGVKLITTLEEKIQVLSRYPIDHLVILEFTKEFSELSYCEFIQQFLVEKLGICHLIVGYNHRFGKNREGDIKKLRSCARNYNFSIEHLEPFSVDGKRISSSLIRQALEDGSADRANQYLGYPFFVSGKVAGGSKVGRSIGFPTANIVPDRSNKMIPGDGVYAVEVYVEGEIQQGMLNIGTRPTVNSNTDLTTIEVNIFEFERDIYEQLVELRFIGRIREEMKFGSIDELRLQLIKDSEVALKILSSRKDK